MDSCEYVECPGWEGEGLMMGVWWLVYGGASVGGFTLEWVFGLTALLYA